MTCVIQTGGSVGYVDDGILGFSGVAFWWAACSGLVYESFLWGLVGLVSRGSSGNCMFDITLQLRRRLQLINEYTTRMLTRLLGITTTRSR
jgi:hypothetical protein